MSSAIKGMDGISGAMLDGISAGGRWQEMNWQEGVGER
jgi:hypothetical protein